MNKQYNDDPHQQDQNQKPFTYNPKLFQLLQKALIEVTLSKPENPIQYVAHYMRENNQE